MAGSRRSPDQLRSVRIKADVDLNVVMTERGSLVEVQGSAEGAPFSVRTLQRLLALARRGTRQLVEVQKKALRK